MTSNGTEATVDAAAKDEIVEGGEAPEADAAAEGQIVPASYAGPPFSLVVSQKVGGSVQMALAVPSGDQASSEQAEVDALIRKGEFDKAVEAAAAALERCQRSGDGKEQVLAQMALARAHEANGEPQEAIAPAEAALAGCREMGETGWAGIALMAVAEAQKSMTDTAAAKQSLQEALEAFQEAGDEHHIAVSSAMLSSVLLTAGEAEESLDVANQALELAQGRNDWDSEGVLWLAVAEAQGANRQYQEAALAAQKASEVALVASHTVGQANALLTLSTMQQKCEDYPGALQAAKQMRALCHKADMYDEEALALVACASVHNAEFQGQMAVKAANAALKVCKRKKHSGMRVHAFCKLAEGHLQVINGFVTSQRVMDASGAKAMEAARQAVAEAEKADEIPLRAEAYFWFAKVLILSSDLEQGMQAADISQQLYQRTGNWKQQAEAILMICRAHVAFDGPNAKTMASSAAHLALEIFMDKKDELGQQRTMRTMGELGLMLRVSGGAAMGMQMMAPGDGQGMPQPDAGQAAQAVSAVAPASKGLEPAMVEQVVTEMAKAAIGLDDAVYLDSPLMDSGMDSLTAVSFRNGLQQNLNVKLPSSMIFDYPTMREVSSRIVELSLEDE